MSFADKLESLLFGGLTSEQRKPIVESFSDIELQQAREAAADSEDYELRRMLTRETNLRREGKTSRGSDVQ